jgi:hypothetical protein
MFYYMAGQIAGIKNDKNETTYVLNQMRLRTYPTQTAPSIIVSDYTASIRYNGKNPIIVGKCNIVSEPQAIVLTKALAKPDMPYAIFEKNFKPFFTDGFVISLNTTDEEKLTQIIPENMKPVGAKVLWKVKYTD